MSVIARRAVHSLQSKDRESSRLARPLRRSPKWTAAQELRRSGAIACIDEQVRGERNIMDTAEPRTTIFRFQVEKYAKAFFAS